VGCCWPGGTRRAQRLALAKAMLDFGQARASVTRRFLQSTHVKPQRKHQLRTARAQESAAARDADAFDEAVDYHRHMSREEKREGVEGHIQAAGGEADRRRDQQRLDFWRMASTRARCMRVTQEAALDPRPSGRRACSRQLIGAARPRGPRNAAIVHAAAEDEDCPRRGPPRAKRRGSAGAHGHGPAWRAKPSAPTLRPSVAPTYHKEGLRRRQRRVSRKGGEGAAAGEKARRDRGLGRGESEGTPRRPRPRGGEGPRSGARATDRHRRSDDTTSRFEVEVPAADAWRAEIRVPHMK